MNNQVLVLMPQKVDQNRKFYRKWHGPYRVFKCTSPDVYLLVNTKTGRRIRRHLDEIRIIRIRNLRHQTKF